MPTGLYFVAMNFSVHAVMYFYYFLAGITNPPPWGMMVTIMQLSQMVIGIIVTCSHIRIMWFGTVANCDGYLPNLGAALAMYASYFFLFAQFFVKRYCLKRSKANGKEKSKAENGKNGKKDD